MNGSNPFTCQPSPVFKDFLYGILLNIRDPFLEGADNKPAGKAVVCIRVREVSIALQNW